MVQTNQANWQQKARLNTVEVKCSCQNTINAKNFFLHNCILSYGGKAAHVIVPNSKSAGGLRDFMLRKANIKTPY